MRRNGRTGIRQSPNRLVIPKNKRTLQSQLKSMLSRSKHQRAATSLCLAQKRLKYPRIRNLVAKNMIDDNLDDFITKFKTLNKTDQVQFRDSFFPPDANSLGNFENLSSLIWLNFSKIFKNYLRKKQQKNPNGTQKYFALYKNFDPLKIENQSIPSSKLLTAIKCLTTRSGLLKRIFDYSKLQDSRLYTVWLNINGLWKSVVVDDFFPFLTHTSSYPKFAFCCSKDDELYPALIEKAMAKYLKSYANLYNMDSKDPEAFEKFLTCMTGSSIIRYELNFEKSGHSRKEIDNNMDEFWLKTRKSLRENHLVILKYGDDGDRNWRFKANKCVNFGIGEGYIIKDAEIVMRSDHKSERILKVKNVMNSNCNWRGKWSKNCYNWTDDLRRKLGYFDDAYVAESKEKDFWISLEDLFAVFSTAYICEVEPFGKYNSADLVVDFDDGEKFSRRKLIKIDIKKDSIYKFEAFLLEKDVEEKGMLVSRMNNGYSGGTLSKFGPQIRMLVGRFHQGNFKFIDFKTTINSFISTKLSLQEGEYIILLEFSSFFVELETATFTTYSEEITDIGIFTQKNTDGMIPLSTYYNFVEYRILKNYILLNADKAQAYKDSNNQNVIINNLGQRAGAYDLPLSYLRLEDYCFLIVPNRFQIGQIVKAKIVDLDNDLFTLKGPQLVDGNIHVMKILPQNFEFCFVKNHDYFYPNQHKKTKIIWESLGVYDKSLEPIDTNQVKIYKFLLKSRPLQNNIPSNKLIKQRRGSGYSDMSQNSAIRSRSQSAASIHQSRSYSKASRRSSFRNRRNILQREEQIGNPILNNRNTQHVFRYGNKMSNSLGPREIPQEIKEEQNFRRVFEKRMRNLPPKRRRSQRSLPGSRYHVINPLNYRPILTETERMRRSQQASNQKPQGTNKKRFSEFLKEQEALNLEKSYMSIQQRETRRRTRSAPKLIPSGLNLFETPMNSNESSPYLDNNNMRVSRSGSNMGRRRSQGNKSVIQRRMSLGNRRPPQPYLNSRGSATNPDTGNMRTIFSKSGDKFPKGSSVNMKDSPRLRQSYGNFRKSTASRLVPRQVTPQKKKGGYRNILNGSFRKKPPKSKS